MTEDENSQRIFFGLQSDYKKGNFFYSRKPDFLTLTKIGLTRFHTRKSIVKTDLNPCKKCKC